MKDLLLKGLNIDWELLRQQKQSLFNVIEKSDNDYLVEDIEGIIGIVSFLQDQAVESGIWTEEEIFGKDLFDSWEELPENIQAIIEKYGDCPDYTECKEMEKELKKHGYTFDVGMDSIPYNLRKIN